MKYKNPILPGFHPDPSICRVGEDFYLVHSTFEFYPGVPVYHSRNLVNWDLTGYCLTRESQVKLHQCAASGGIFAPTLRHHEGTFYMCTTNVSDRGNFIVHTKDITGSWSEPVWVDQEGIDPSILFDEDGTVYFCTAVFTPGKEGIYLSEIDPDTGVRLTAVRKITDGCGGRCAEGPHLYRLFGKYYLFLAEGGTEYGHSETVLRADTPYGPYEECPHNPLISHRNRMGDEIQCVGHADLTEDPNGNWWLVSLGVRPLSVNGSSVMLHNLGRETFLTPLSWDEQGWPVVEGAKTAIWMEGTLPGEIEETDWSFRDDFSREQLNLRYAFLRNPDSSCYQLDPKHRGLRLRGTELTLNDQDSPSFLGIRQWEFSVRAEVRFSVESLQEGGRIGITAFYNEDYHYEIYVTKKSGRYYICTAKKVHDILAESEGMELKSCEFQSSEPEGLQDITLRIIADRQAYSFCYVDRKGKEWLCGKGMTAGLSTEQTWKMSFTGVMLGMFAENGIGQMKWFSVEE